MKNYFVTNMYEKFSHNCVTYVDIKYVYAFLPLPVKMDLENSKKLESIVNIFVFCIKISCQSKESSLFKQSLPFSPTPPFLEKVFHPTLITKLEQVNPPFVKGEVWTMIKNPLPCS